MSICQSVGEQQAQSAVVPDCQKGRILKGKSFRYIMVPECARESEGQSQCIRVSEEDCQRKRLSECQSVRVSECQN